MIPDTVLRSWLNSSVRTGRATGMATSRTTTWTYHSNSIHHHVLLAQVAGDVAIRQKTSEIKLSPGMVCVLPPGAAYRQKKTGGTASVQIKAPLLLLQQQPLTSHYLALLPLPCSVACERRQLIALAQQVEANCKGFRCKSNESRITVSMAVEQLLATWMIEGFRTGALLREPLKVEPYILKLRDYIEQNYKRADLRLNDLARYCGYTPTTFSPLFTATFGASPMNYLQRYRIAMASRLLASAPLIKIEQIIQRVGYRNRSLFFLHFKRWTGQTPKAFLNNSERKQAG